MAQFEDLEPVERHSTASIIADRIRGGIRDGTFPSGTQLGEARLAQRLNVSRGPVREALQRLIQERLLEARPHRGVFVRSLDADEIDDIYLARTVIERAAVQRVAIGATETDIAGLGALLDRMDDAAREQSWDRVAELDLEFHLGVIQAAGSPRLERMYQTLIIETSMCLRALESAYPRREDLVAEHRDLCRAMADRKPDEAADLVTEHMQAAVAGLSSAEEQQRPAGS